MPGNVTVRSLICEDGLGYCCTWFFFQHYRNSETIADRLGVTSRAVRLAKARVDSGDVVCERHANCMHARMTLEGNPRQRPPQPNSAKRDDSDKI